MTPTRIPFSNRNRLRIAAAVCLLGAVAGAHAALITRNVNQTVSAAALGSYDLDVDQNGGTDFSFEAAFSADPFLGNLAFSQIRVPFASSNAFVVASGAGSGFALVSRLLAGANLSAASLFSSLGDRGELASEFFAPPTGNFLGQTGFVGLRFMGTAGLLFGFAQVTVAGLNAPDPYSITIGQVGFENSGAAVQIPTGTAVPEPGSLALLAAAGIGFLATRRRRSGAAT